MSLIKIGNKEYEINEVALSITEKADVDRDLEFDLFADCQNLSKAGFAINCLTMVGMRKTSELASHEFSLTTNSPDPLNELAESVVCLPGRAIDLESLHLEFGSFEDDHIDVRLSAKCYEASSRADHLEVSGQFRAKVKVRRPYAGL